MQNVSAAAVLLAVAHPPKEPPPPKRLASASDMPPKLNEIAIKQKATILIYLFIQSPG